MIMRILLSCALSPFSGYGNDGIGMMQALVRAGHDVVFSPGLVSPPLPIECLQVLGKTLTPPFDLMIDHRDPNSIEIEEGAWRASRRAVSWTMWEYTTMDNAKNKRTLVKRLRPNDLLISYDPGTAGALAPYAEKAKIPTTILQGGFDPSSWPFVERDWDGPFRFCMVGALSHRKDPFLAIQAFQELKEELVEDFKDAELHLKTNVKSLHPGMMDVIPGLKIHYATWPQDVLLKFYQGCHVLLAPSRGEGKNVPALEAQSTGMPVIATDVGGHTMWLNEKWGYKLDHVMMPADPRWPDCLEARATLESMKAQMLHVYNNRNEARLKGELAARTIPNMCSWDKVVENLLLRVAQVPSREPMLT